MASSMYRTMSVRDLSVFQKESAGEESVIYKCIFNATRVFVNDEINLMYVMLNSACVMLFKGQKRLVK